MAQLLILLFCFSSYAKVDKIYSEAYLGEKSLDSYSERYQPLVIQDIHQGKLSFADDIFFQAFFNPYLFEQENDYGFFFRSELNAGLACPNNLLSEHFEDIRYSYRLITLSYLLEGQWHNKLISDHFRLKTSCEFELQDWVSGCKPKSAEMRKFLSRLNKFAPKYDESLPSHYKKEDWWNEFKSEKYKWYSHYRMKSECDHQCSKEKLAINFKNICNKDQELMTLICSEEDEIYGLSTNRDAYYLLGLSNIINTYNQKSQATGCLRRFSETMAHKEVRYSVLDKLFPALQTYLRQKYNERFIQGRAFFYGSGKEFDEKGFSDLYVKEQPIKIEKPIKEKDEPKVVEVPKVVETPKPQVKKEVVVVAEVSKEKPPKEISKPLKSAFLQAAEIRKSHNLERVEVDMKKLKYDYIFSLNMINTLAERMKSFMTREALVEMMNYDKLGTKEGPVPLMFLKYMIDMHEHHGLWNIISVVGDKFYVSNEIDGAFTPSVEMVELSNNEASGGQWQLTVLRPN